MKNKLAHFVATGLILGSVSLQGPAQQIKIGLFYSDVIQSFTVSPVRSDYHLTIDTIADGDIRPGQILYISLMDNKLSVSIPGREVIGCQHVFLHAVDSGGVFSLRPAFPAMQSRLYDGDLIFSADVNRIMAYNEVSFDKYIAGVIESEGGIKAPVEFYKAQAVLCRTYALANLNRHASEGFNLCDGVHCQAYLSCSDHNDEILHAVEDTHDEVAVYNDSILITAAFHSNCGGETQSSANEWTTALPYLQSVTDPYCRDARNSRWQKIFTLSEWRKYLNSCGIQNADSLPPSRFNFVQHTRKVYYVVNHDSIPLKKIRSDLGLKSSFFSISYIRPDRIVIDGRGYGHGIGLCQEGAMNMATNGFDYREILHFYFTGISIKKYLYLLRAS